VEIALVSTLFVQACGYRLIGTEIRVPGGIRSVSVGTFDNRSRQFGLDKTLAFAMEREIYRRGILHLVEDPAGADAVLKGTIREFQTRPVAFDAKDEAIQYEAEMTLDVRLERQDSGEVLWEGAKLQAIEEYSVTPSTIIPSSAQFQLDTLNFENLNQLTDIQLAETEKRLAIDRLVATLVRDVQDRMLDEF
jgi:hypothetical protein